MAKNNIIPVFIPFAGCPFKCVYCNQKEITGHSSIPTIEDLGKQIEEEVKYFKSTNPIELAFYGGTFTMLPFDLQMKYFSFLQNYLKKGTLSGIRISTRPDAIVESQILKLKELGLKTIEFGIQSSDQKVINLSGRNIDLNKSIENIELVKNIGFKVGLQQMIGLPEDTYRKTLETANWIKKRKPDFVRIYPTIVLKDTELEKMFLAKEYNPLSLKEAVFWSADLLDFYEENNIDVIRVGLPPLEDISAYVSGPYDVQFREYAESLRYVNKLAPIIKKFSLDKDLSLQASQRVINRIVGPNRYGKKIIEELVGKIPFRPILDKEVIIISSDTKRLKLDISKLPWSEICI